MSELVQPILCSYDKYDKFADNIKLGEAVGSLEGRKALKRDIDVLELHSHQPHKV